MQHATCPRDLCSCFLRPYRTSPLHIDTRPHPCKLPTSFNLVSSFPMHMPTSPHAHQPAIALHTDHSSTSMWCTSPRHAPTDAPRHTEPNFFPLVHQGGQSLHLQASDRHLYTQAWSPVAAHPPMASVARLLPYARGHLTPTSSSVQATCAHISAIMKRTSTRQILATKANEKFKRVVGRLH